MEQLILDAVKLGAGVILGFLLWLVIGEKKPRTGDAPSGTGAATSGGKAGKKAPLPKPEQVLQLIKSRRSVFPKDYNGAGPPVTLDGVRMCLDAARWAPTHKRTEPWRYVVISGDGRKHVFNATLEANKAATDEARGGETFEEVKEWFEEDVEKEWSKCDFMVAIIMQRQAHPEKRLPEWEELCALGGSVQNFHLMATSLGIAGYWSSWNPVGRDSKGMARFLGLEPEDRCLGFFCLASSDRIGKYRSGRKPLDDFVRYVDAAEGGAVDWS